MRSRGSLLSSSSGFVLGIKKGLLLEEKRSIWRCHLFCSIRIKLWSNSIWRWTNFPILIILLLRGPGLCYFFFYSFNVNKLELNLLFLHSSTTSNLYFDFKKLISIIFHFLSKFQYTKNDFSPKKILFFFTLGAT